MIFPWDSEIYCCGNCFEICFFDEYIYYGGDGKYLHKESFLTCLFINNNSTGFQDECNNQDPDEPKHFQFIEDRSLCEFPSLSLFLQQARNFAAYIQ